MESAKDQLEIYEMPSYSYVNEKQDKSEGSNKISQKYFTGTLKHSLKRTSVVFKAVCLIFFTVLVILVAVLMSDVRNLLQKIQGNMPREGSNGTIEERDNKPCYNLEIKSGQCAECSADEKCFNECHEEGSSSSSCLGYQKEDCHLVEEYSNMHHYFTPPGYPDNTDSGRVQYVSYPKKSADTGIRIQFNANTIAHNGSAGCNRWFVKFNGNECASPAAIEMMDSSSTPQLFSRNMDMDGLCYGIASGVVNVEIWIDSCSTSSNAITGWLGARQLTIMEVVPLQPVKGSSVKPCAGLTHFNLFYETWLQSGETTFNTAETAISIRTTVYNKLANDSALRIKYQAPLSVLVDQPEGKYCARWFIEINGTHCSPEGDFIIFPHPPENYNYARYHSRTRTLECICENDMPAGPVLVELKIGKCIPYPSVAHVKYGELYRPSRLFIEEIRLNRSTDAILGLDGKLYRSVFTKISRFHWYSIYNELDLGDILSVTYFKHYSRTALKLTSSGDHRTVASGCARWYFKINGAECGNPGVIDAISADFHPTNLHMPMQTTGHCYGLSSGTYTITYSVSNCPGNVVRDYYTGWGSAFNIFVEEVQLDYMKYCYGPSCN